MSECSVYIIATLKDGVPVAPVKVGISRSVGSRVATIATSSPEPVTLYLSFCLPARDMAEAVERAFHKVMANARKNGEWFNLPPEHARTCMMVNVGYFLNKAVGLSAKEVDDTLRDFGLLPQVAL